MSRYESEGFCQRLKGAFGLGKGVAGLAQRIKRSWLTSLQRRFIKTGVWLLDHGRYP